MDEQLFDDVVAATQEAIFLNRLLKQVTECEHCGNCACYYGIGPLYHTEDDAKVMLGL